MMNPVQKKILKLLITHPVPGLLAASAHSWRPQWTSQIPECGRSRRQVEDSSKVWARSPSSAQTCSEHRPSCLLPGRLYPMPPIHQFYQDRTQWTPVNRRCHVDIFHTFHIKQIQSRTHLTMDATGAVHKLKSYIGQSNWRRVHKRMMRPLRNDVIPAACEDHSSCACFWRILTVTGIVVILCK